MTKAPKSNSGKAPPASEKTLFSFPFNVLPFQPMEVGGTDMMSQWKNMNRFFMDWMVNVQEETGRFVTHRFEQEFEYQKRLLSCRTPEEYWDACTGFAGQAFTDYSEEATKLVGMADQFQQAASGHLGKEAMPTKTKATASTDDVMPLSAE